jgi:uncharacterized protein (TIGR02246 family)
MEKESEIQKLLDESAIRDLVRRYAHCVWQKDAAGAAGLFAEDGVMDTGDRPPLEGKAAILEEYTQTFDTSIFYPFIHNHVIDVTGQQARGTAYIELRGEVEGVRMEGYGWYDDQYIQTAAGWKFCRRRLQLLHYGPVEA